MSRWHHLYVSTTWKKLRVWHLTRNPLCVMCLKEDRLTPANVVDHVKPHRGDMALFRDPLNLQSLCEPHHNRDKQRGEAAELLAVPAVDEDGYPINGEW